MRRDLVRRGLRVGDRVAVRVRPGELVGRVRGHVGDDPVDNRSTAGNLTGRRGDIAVGITQGRREGRHDLGRRVAVLRRHEFIHAGLGEEDVDLLARDRHGVVEVLDEGRAGRPDDLHLNVGRSRRCEARVESVVDGVVRENGSTRIGGWACLNRGDVAGLDRGLHHVGDGVARCGPTHRAGGAAVNEFLGDG